MNPGFTTFLISAGTVTFLSFAVTWLQNRKRKAGLLEKERKLREQILSSSDASWKKVGSVKELFFYPLKSGKGKPIEQCNFEEYGITVDDKDGFRIKDRMFMVYDEKTGKFKTGRDHPKLLLVSVSPVDKDRAKLEVADVAPLVFNLPKATDKNVNEVDCSMWWGEPTKCLDCGPEASAWLSKFLIGSDAGLRLGLCSLKNHRNITTGPWEKYAAAYNLRDEDAGLFADLVSYMVLSDASVNDLNQRLKNPIQSLQLRPNIVVEGCEPYAEDQWEWIKIGKDAIIRNVKLCTRCSMVRIDPETGIPDSQYEPLKTLRSYRKLKNVELDELEHHAPAIGVYCGLHRTGIVRLDDDIRVYKPEA